MEPMLALPVLPDKLYKYSHYVMEPKLDGIRCIAYKDIDGYVSLTSRGGKDLTAKVPHIRESLSTTMYYNTYLDGELGYWSGSYTIDFNKTTRVLGSGVRTALEKQSDDEHPMQYFVFDDCNEHWPDRERRKNLEYWYLLHYRANYEPTVALVPRMERFDMEWYDAYVEAGGEGVMLKNPDACYYEGKRKANTWYKLKKFDTIDGIIVGKKEGLGKYTGMCGALVVAYQKNPDDVVLHHVHVAGMDDDHRREFWNNFEEYELKWIEVKHFGFTAGTPRFPQFLRMRPDLD